MGETLPRATPKNNPCLLHIVSCFSRLFQTRLHEIVFTLHSHHLKIFKYTRQASFYNPQQPTMSSPEPQDESQPISGSPSEFLRNIVGKRVKVRIGSGVDYTGVFVLLDVPSVN